MKRPSSLLALIQAHTRTRKRAHKYSLWHNAADRPLRKRDACQGSTDCRAHVHTCARTRLQRHVYLHVCLRVLARARVCACVRARACVCVRDREHLCARLQLDSPADRMSLMTLIRVPSSASTSADRQAFQYAGLEDPTKLMQLPSWLRTMRIDMVDQRMMVQGVERGWIRIS